MNNTPKNYLKQALVLAELRRGFCAPNPCVGAVLVKNKKIIASGYHWACGSPHAEADVLNKIGPDIAKGATLYVTLQPCCHTDKRTPPCTQLLIEKKVAEVVYGFRNPNPSVNKQSDQILQRAGITCSQQSLAEIDRFYTSYQFWWENKRPFLTAKLAMSLDGKIAGPGGQRIQLTGKMAQSFTHQQRLRTDAILTTAKTISCDNPSLNSRINNSIISKPIYILDSELKTPPSATLFDTAKSITFFHKPNVDRKKQEKYNREKQRFIPINHKNDRLNLLAILEQIGQDGYHDLWVEAGGSCLQAFAENKLLQRAFIYVAPRWLGQEAQSAFTNPKVLAGTNILPMRQLGVDACFEFNWIK